MRRDIIKDVEIIEPPLEEMTKKYSTFSSIKRSCLGGCGCFIIFIIIIVVAFKMFLGAGPQEIKTVPPNFPIDVPVYDEENIDRITFVSGQYKNRSVEVAAIFPKLILSPLLSVVEKDEVTAPKNEKESAKNIWKIISSPVSDKRNMVKIEWKNLPAEFNFVYNYYKNELTKSGYTIDAISASQTEKQFSFSQGENTGSFYVKIIDQNQTNTEYASLIINYNASKIQTAR